MMMMMMMMMMAVKDRHQQLACIHDQTIHDKQVHPQSPRRQETRRRQEPVVDDNKSASEGIGRQGPSSKKLLHQPVVKASILIGFGNG